MGQLMGLSVGTEGGAWYPECLAFSGYQSGHLTEEMKNICQVSRAWLRYLYYVFRIVFQ